MSRRHQEALSIQEGACNPSGIALSIVDACREFREEASIGRASEDPAIRLMVHQLAYICDSSAIDGNQGEYSRLIELCKAQK